jgi:hypothetical protein
MEWYEWTRLTPDGTRIDVPEFYRRCAHAIEAGLPPSPHLTYSGIAGAVALFDDPDYARSPALTIPMTRFHQHYNQPWNPVTAAAAFRELADILDDEIPPHRRHRGR